MLKTLIAPLRDRAHLDSAQVGQAVVALVDPAVSDEDKAEFLIALSHKGETTDEIAAFASQMRDRSIQPELDRETRCREILDVCGTGGDKLNTFNISTTVSIIAAAAGVTVAKHGNRAITSRSGSADVLEELGIPTNLGPDEAARWLRERNFAFFLAPNFHPSFKAIAASRKICAERGCRTIFNFLGPLLNPVKPTAQLMGVPRPELCEPLARVLQTLGSRRVMVVSGKTPHGHLDELSILDASVVAEFYQDRGFNFSELHPHHYSFSPARLEDLSGGDKVENAAIIRAILSGKERGARRDAVLFNSGAALFVGNAAKSIMEGMEFAAELIDSGRASRKLAELTAR